VTDDSFASFFSHPLGVALIAAVVAVITAPLTVKAMLAQGLLAPPLAGRTKRGGACPCRGNRRGRRGLFRRFAHLSHRHRAVRARAGNAIPCVARTLIAMITATQPITAAN
jgi:hypothetical protein